MKNKKNGNLNTQIEKYFATKIRPSLIMQNIKKQRNISRQLFEAVNFAFMNFFDFLVKIAISWAFLLFLGDLCHEFLPRSSGVWGM